MQLGEIVAERVRNDVRSRIRLGRTLNESPSPDLADQGDRTNTALLPPF